MDFIEILKLTGFLILSYLIGSIPSGLILTKLLSKGDILQSGSNNIGATNVARTSGYLLGALTLIGDMLKGALPVWLALSLSENLPQLNFFYPSIIALAAFGGHLYPAYMRFKNGGKGVATAAGIFMILSPMACLVAVLVFILLLFIFRRVSAGSLAGAAILPPAVWVFSRTAGLTACALIIAVFIFYRHKANIKRLIAGTEPVFIKKNNYSANNAKK